MKFHRPAITPAVGKALRGQRQRPVAADRDAQQTRRRLPAPYLAPQVLLGVIQRGL